MPGPVDLVVDSTNTRWNSNGNISALDEIAGVPRLNVDKNGVGLLQDRPGTGRCPFTELPAYADSTSPGDRRGDVGPTPPVADDFLAGVSPRRRPEQSASSAASSNTSAANAARHDDDLTIVIDGKGGGTSVPRRRRRHVTEYGDVCNCLGHSDATTETSCRRARHILTIGSTWAARSSSVASAGPYRMTAASARALMSSTVVDDESSSLPQAVMIIPSITMPTTAPQREHVCHSVSPCVDITRRKTDG